MNSPKRLPEGFTKDQTLSVPVRKLPEGTPAETSDRDGPPTSRRRQATVYDAVAGKVSSNQGPGADLQAKTIKYSTKEAALAPDEVLFRRKDAPNRYFEHDIYHAHERQLPRGGQGVLPESDLLKAIHGYTSKFYGAKERDPHAAGDWTVDARSMDETALLAFGILLEEAGKEVLGRRGDLVFTEGADDAPGPARGGDEVADPRVVVGHQDAGLLKRRKGSKRRKVAGTKY
ncbi:hypothetical protein G7046_g6451 [Stylonectria norvegica]|nr:hypothetical protein G7046_g6451 [Stylonectria norvegica]